MRRPDVPRRQRALALLRQLEARLGPRDDTHERRLACVAIATLPLDDVAAWRELADRTASPLWAEIAARLPSIGPTPIEADDDDEATC